MVTMLEYFLSRDIGPSPNGKALDSDSSIFKVRILVAQLLRTRCDLVLFLLWRRVKCGMLAWLHLTTANHRVVRREEPDCTKLFSI